MNDRLHPLLQQQISHYLPADCRERPDLNRFIDEVNKSCYSPLATPVLPRSASESESAFLSIVSHEVRTPMNALLGLVQFMQNETMPPVWQDHFQTLQVSVDSMHMAISNILDYRQISIGQLSLNTTTFSPRQVLDALLRTSRHTMQGTGIRLTLSVADDVPALVQGDPVRLTQVLTNLLTTARTFAGQGAVTLRVSQQQTPDGPPATTFAIDLPDSDPVQYAMLTGAASTDDSTHPQPLNGLGLGLFVSQRLLRLYGSSLRVERRAGQQLTVSFAIPFFVAAETPQAATPPATTAQTLAGLRVLIVEDYPINVRIAGRFLERWEVEMEVAENGQVALDKYQPGRYDLILMDVQMPVMDGLAATRAIRTFDAQVPIVALTASATAADQANAYAAGMTTFLAKPFNSDELFRTLLRYGRRAA